MNTIEIIAGLALVGVVGFGGYEVIEGIKNIPNKIKGDIIPHISMPKIPNIPSKLTTNYINYYSTKVDEDMANEKEVDERPVSYYEAKEASHNWTDNNDYNPEDPLGYRTTSGKWITGKQSMKNKAGGEAGFMDLDSLGVA